MPNIDIPLVGPTYTSRSLPVTAQVTRNFYIEINREASTIAAFQPFPGMKLFSTIVGSDRGTGLFNGVLYKVNSNTLYSVNSSGVSTSIGTIPGSERCVLQDDNINLVIAYGAGKPITWDGTTLTTGTDVDLPSARTVTYIKRRVVYDGSGQNVAFADLDAPLTVNSANLTLADIKPGNVMAVKARLAQLYVFSADAVTPYYNRGVGNPPYDTIENAIQTIGLKAIHSVATNTNYVYFLGSDLRVYRIGSLQLQPIGNPSIGQAIAGYLNPENAIGLCFSFHEQNFYYLTFPSEESWLFSEDAGWTNLSHGTSGDSHLINSYQQIYNKHIVSSRLDGHLYELDFETYQDNGGVIQRQRDTSEIDGKSLGFPGKQLTMSRLEIKVEGGVGLLSGQGTDPQVMMQYSDDSGRSWSQERWKSLGLLGDYKKPIEWFQLGSFFYRMFRFRVSDPVKVVLISANADIKVERG